MKRMNLNLPALGTLILASLAVNLAAVPTARAQDIDPEGVREATVPVETPAELAAPTVPPPANELWTTASLDVLLAVIKDVSLEGLNPASYAPDKLRTAIDSGDAAIYGPLATQTWLQLAHDFAFGHAPAAARLDWHMDTLAGDPNEAMTALNNALATGQLRETLYARLPNSPQYLALRDMLAKTQASKAETIGQLRVSMERWRWMPRDFGSSFIFVNVPAFNVALVQDGRALARHRIIVGKPKNPTPQLFVQATGVIINPTWTVPQSIIRESVGELVTRHPKKARAQGYVTTIVNGQMQVVQGPGPNNALGAMKLVMPNPYSIYLHDTPAKSLFENKVRAFSHGCIRTDQALRFASVMLREVPGWTRAKIDQTVTGRKTTKVDLPRPFNVLITYLTAVAEDNGKLKTYPDIYGRDIPVLEALDD